MKKLIIFMWIILLSGCWNYRELNELGIATGIAIDKKDDEYILTYMIANSKKQGSENEEATTTVYSGYGKSIYEATKDMALSVPKEIYVGHVDIIILSKEIANEGIENALDFLFRYPQTRNQFYLLVADGCDAKDVFKVTIPLESFPSQNISKNLETTDDLQGFTYKVTFNELIDDLLSEGINPVLPTIKIIGDVEIGNKEENIKQNEPSTYLKLGMLGIFKNDKLLEISSKDESMGINLLNKKIKTLVVRTNYDNGYAVMHGKDAKASYDINYNDVKIKITMNGSIHEITSDINLSDNNIIKDLKTKFEKEITDKAYKAIFLAQSNKTDIFGIGNKIYKKNYKYWYTVRDSWDDLVFPNLNITVETEINLISKGSLNNIIKGDS